MHNDISTNKNCLTMIKFMGRIVNFLGECTFKIMFYSFVIVQSKSTVTAPSPPAWHDWGYTNAFIVLMSIKMPENRGMNFKISNVNEFSFFLLHVHMYGVGQRLDKLTHMQQMNQIKHSELRPTRSYVTPGPLVMQATEDQTILRKCGQGRQVATSTSRLNILILNELYKQSKENTLGFYFQSSGLKFLILIFQFT